MLNQEPDKPEDNFYKLSVNCRFKARIQALLTQLKQLNQRFQEMNDKQAALKKALNLVIRIFKPVKGDPIDEMWCNLLNEINLRVPCVRTAPAKYLFGTRNISCKIVNGKLLVRIGGGYISAYEFIEQFANIEMAKVMRDAGDPEFESSKRSTKSIGGSLMNNLNESIVSDKKVQSVIFTQE